MLSTRNIRRRRIRAALALGGAAVVALALTVPQTATAAPVSAKAPEVTTVATGLDNPRGLAFGKDGALYIAEAGRGGDLVECFAGPEGETCLGASGAVTTVSYGHQRRVVTGLPSLAGPDGSFGIGPSDVAPVSRHKLLLTVGLGADPALRDTLPAIAQQLGTLRQFSPNGRHQRKVADIGDFEAEQNPDGGLPDTNPNSVLTRKGRQGSAVVADAGGNSLLRVRNHKVSTIAVFPTRNATAPDGSTVPMQAVPTGVVRGPDGAYYVSQLTGFPFPQGGANIYRVVPGHAPTVFASGFTNVIDLAFGPHGTLYVLEIFHNGLLSGDPTGALIKVRRDGSQRVVLSEGLVTPGGLAIRGPSAYVSNCGTCAGDGHVLRVGLR